MKMNELLKTVIPTARIQLFSVNGIYHGSKHKAGDLLDKTNSWTVSELWPATDNLGSVLVVRIQKEN